MKFNPTLFALYLVIFMLSACKPDGSKNLINGKANKHIDEVTKTRNYGDFEYGPWKIDSVGEENSIQERLSQKSPIQVFHFRKSGLFSITEITPKVTNDRVMGNWNSKDDSVFIVSDNGAIAMRYAYKINGQTLTLRGNFHVSENNKKTPIFYLSKYVEGEY